MLIRVETLGSVAVTVDGVSAASLLTKPVRSAVFLYVVVEPAPTRDGLIELFWSDRTAPKARRACNQTLYQLRQDLGDEWLVSTGNRLEVHADVETDLAEFERALREDRTEDALALYHGPFLRDLGSLGGVAFEHWADRIRARVERAHRKARSAAIESALTLGDLDCALAHSRQWVELDPVDDEANHTRIDLLGRAGARDAALHCYALYRDRLRREHEVDPMPETLELVEAIREGRAAPDAGRLTVAPLGARPAGRPVGSAPDRATPERAPAAGGLERRVRLALVTVGLVAVALLLFRPWARPQSAFVAAPGVLDPAIIAILPLENWSGDRELAAIANGLRETMALELHGNERLTVISNPAVRALTEAGTPTDSIARRFHAGTIITGAVTRAGGGVRVDVGVTDARNADPYEPIRVERPDSEIPMLEADLLVALSGFLREHLGHRVELARTLPDRLSRVAYTSYETGRLFLQDARDRDAAGQRLAETRRLLECADSALQVAQQQARDWIAPILLRGWVSRELARVHGTRDTAQYRRFANDAIAAAESVLSVSPENPDALELRGTALMYLGVSLADTAAVRRGVSDLEQSYHFDQNRASTLRSLSFAGLQAGDLEQAKSFAGKALEEDPFAMSNANLIAGLVFATRADLQVEDANQYCERGWRQHPDDFRFTDCILANAAVLGTPRITPDSARQLALRADSLDPLRPDADPVYLPYYRQVLVATVMLAAGEREAALDLMEQTVAAAQAAGLEKAIDYDRAFFEFKAGKHAEARRLLRQYMQSNPQFERFARADRRWDGFTETLTAKR